MPTYDLRCVSCARREEVIVPIAYRNSQTCSACGDSMGQVISPVPVVGARGDRPVVLGNGHVVAESPAQVREYEERTGHQTVSTSSTDWKNHMIDLKDSATKYVERMGYDSVEDFRANHSKKVDQGEV